MPFVPDLDAARALWDHLPQGVLVVDDCGTIRIVNARALAMTGWTASDEVVGRSILEFIEPDDVAFVAAGLDRSDDFAGVVLGPFRIRYRTRHGNMCWTESWAYEAPQSVGFAGHVVTMMAESVADGLSVATRQVAAGDALDVSLSTTARSLAAFPVVATASILSLDHGRIVSTIGSWPLDLPPSEGSADAPWERCIIDGDALDTPVRDLPSIWQREARKHRFESVWVRAIEAGGRRGVLVMWRHSAVPPTPNQHRNIDDAVDIARLAFAQHDHHRRLALAAQTDHLTDAYNRAKLDAVIESGLVPAGVIYIDLDDFKAVNDDYGHLTGDLVLQHVAHRLGHLVADRDHLYRVGGDEFVIVVTHPTHRGITELAAAVVDAVDQPIIVDGHRIEITASVGAAENPDARPIPTLLREADQHLLTAKHAGKHRWHAQRQPA